ncbi:hypothetical protein [Streptomyces sp. 891-h]|uniref:hypothetical protein n=1 Tax=Streptomyces sp. 891-h TaxID=2720714 RepID=UPI001FAAB1D3|nr:hypothetical protein [Streptomyces sp. 891-h]UNZ20596.1 hypothetical protein HC362_29570 [Streptomyces sp. 891-h]
MIQSRAWLDRALDTLTPSAAVPDTFRATPETTMTNQPADRPFANEPTEILRAALGLASQHAEQAARFRPAQPDDTLPSVVDLLNAELQHREPTLLPPPQGPEYTPCSSCTHIEPEHQPDAGPCLVCDCTAYAPAAVSSAVAPPTTRQTHGVSIPHDGALSDAIATRRYTH